MRVGNMLLNVTAVELAGRASERPISEHTVVAAAKSGETRALDQLYHLNHKRILCTLSRITKNREDAEDALQDSFLRALLNPKSFDGRSTFSTWLTRIAINSALMILHERRESPEFSLDGRSTTEVLLEVSDPSPDPERRYAEQERRRILKDAINGLHPSIRRFVELHTLEDRSMTETAAQIGISVSAVKARVFHAKAALRRSKVLRRINNRPGHQQFSRFWKSGVIGAEAIFVRTDVRNEDDVRNCSSYIRDWIGKERD
jgi:RNA polymerase sigma factor (sigma-70 family)